MHSTDTDELHPEPKPAPIHLTNGDVFHTDLPQRVKPVADRQTEGRVDRSDRQVEGRPDPSDAESVSTTTSQDSRESNKENLPRLEEGVTLRKKPEFHRVSKGELNGPGGL